MSQNKSLKSPVPPSPSLQSASSGSSSGKETSPKQQKIPKSYPLKSPVLPSPSQPSASSGSSSGSRTDSPVTSIKKLQEERGRLRQKKSELGNEISKFVRDGTESTVRRKTDHVNATLKKEETSLDSNYELPKLFKADQEQSKARASLREKLSKKGQKNKDNTLNKIEGKVKSFAETNKALKLNKEELERQKDLQLKNNNSRQK